MITRNAYSTKSHESANHKEFSSYSYVLLINSHKATEYCSPYSKNVPRSSLIIIHNMSLVEAHHSKIYT